MADLPFVLKRRADFDVRNDSEYEESDDYWNFNPADDIIDDFDNFDNVTDFNNAWETDIDTLLCNFDHDDTLLKIRNSGTLLRLYHK